MASAPSSQVARRVRERSVDGVAERVYAREDGVTWSEFSVRYQDEHGKRRRAVFRTRRDALDFKTAVAYARRHGLALPKASGDARAEAVLAAVPSLAPGEVTLGDYVRSEYWRLYALEELDPRTLRDYENAWRVHLEPSLGHLPLTEIRQKAIRRWQAERRSAGVGPGALAKARTMLGSVFTFAVEEEVLSSHPLRQSRRRNSNKSKALRVRRKPVRPPGPAAIETIRASMLAKDRQVGATLLVLIAYAGLRPGEALALRWANILKQTTLVEDGSDNGQPKEIKNGIAYRSVALVGPLRDDLERLRRHLEVSQSSTTPVIPNAAGGHWTDEEYKRWRARHYKPAAVAAGITEPKPYHLRHAFVSLRVREGTLTLGEIAEQAGHTVETLLRVYRHEIDEYRGRDMPQMEAAIHEARKHAVAVPYLTTGLDKRKR